MASVEHDYTCSIATTGLHIWLTVTEQLLTRGVCTCVDIPGMCAHRPGVAGVPCGDMAMYVQLSVLGSGFTRGVAS